MVFSSRGSLERSTQIYALGLIYLEQENEVKLFSSLPTILNPQERDKEK